MNARIPVLIAFFITLCLFDLLVNAVQPGTAHAGRLGRNSSKSRKEDRILLFDQFPCLVVTEARFRFGSDRLSNVCGVARVAQELLSPGVDRACLVGCESVAEWDNGELF